MVDDSEGVIDQFLQWYRGALAEEDEREVEDVSLMTGECVDCHEPVLTTKEKVYAAHRREEEILCQPCGDERNG